MQFIKLSMIENETVTEGEDDNVQVTAEVAETYVQVEGIRSIHKRKMEDGVRKPGTRIAFNNGSQFSVTEEVEAVAALLGWTAPPTIN